MALAIFRRCLHRQTRAGAAVFDGNGIAGELDFGGEGFRPGGGDADMHMGAATAVGDGRHGFEVILAIGGTGDLAAQAEAGVVVLAFGIDVPHFDPGAGEGTPPGIEDFARDPEGLAVHAFFTERAALRRSGFVERPEADVFSRDLEIGGG